MRAEILEIKGDRVVLKMYDEITRKDIEHYKIDDRLFATLELFESNSITPAQRRHIYALFGDQSASTGDSVEAWKNLMKVELMHREYLQEYPSLANNKMTKDLASKFIEMIVIYCIRKNISFRKNRKYLPRESSNYVYWATVNRNCVICGKPNAEIHHFDAVGMGRDRTKVDHREHGLLALCYTHHRIAHNKGVQWMYENWHIAPIKLSERDLRKLNIQGDYKNNNHFKR